MSRGVVNPGHSTFPSSTLPTPSPSSATIPLSFSGSFEDLGRYAELFSSFAYHQADSSGKLDTSRALYNMETQKSGDDGRRGRSVSRGGSRGPTFRGGNNTGRGGSISSAGSRERHEEHFVDAQSLSSRSHSHSRPPVERHSSQSGLFQSTGSNISHHDPLMLLANTIAQQQALDQTHNQHGSHPVTMPPPAPILPPYNPNFPTTGHTGTSHSLPPITNFPWPYNSSSSLQLDPSLMAGQNHQSAYEFLHSLPSGLGSSGTQVSSSPQTPYHGFPFLPLLGPSVPQNIPLNTQLIYLQLQQQALAQAHQQHQDQLARAQRQPSLLTQQRPVSLNSSAESTSSTPTSTTPSAPAPPPPRNFNPVRLSASAPESSTMSPSDSATPIDTAADIAEEKRRRNTAASARFRVKKKMRSIELTRTISDLEGRALDLEKEAEGLRRENTWLKEMVILKGKRNMEILQAYSLSTSRAGTTLRANGNTNTTGVGVSENGRAGDTSDDERNEIQEISPPSSTSRSKEVTTVSHEIGTRSE